MSRQDFTKEIPREERKLDTIARFITGHSVCAAIIYHHLPDGNSQLIISTNKMSISDADKLNNSFAFNKPAGDEMDDKNIELYNNLLLIQKIKNENSYNSNEIQEELKGIFGRGFPSKIFRNFKELIQVSVLKKNISREMYDNLITDDKSNYYKAIEYFYLNRAEFIEAAKSSPEENEFLPKFMSYVEDIYNRINHDVKKLIRAIKSDDDFATTIAKGHFVFAPPKEDNINDKVNNHAEMNIVHYLIEHDLYATWYVGVSKLCCFHCANDIATINAHKGRLKILVRGEHGVGFVSERIAPDFSKYLAREERTVIERAEEFYIRLLLGTKTLAEYMARLEEDRNAQTFLQGAISVSDGEEEVLAMAGAGAGYSYAIEA